MIVLLQELFTVSRVHENNINLINSSASCGQTHDIKKTINLFYLLFCNFEKVKNRVYSHLLLVYNLKLMDWNNNS